MDRKNEESLFVRCMLLIGMGLGTILILSGLTSNFWIQDYGSRLLRLGILTLIATPVARVLALGIAYARAQDWRFAGACLLVLLLLAVSMALSLA